MVLAAFGLTRLLSEATNTQLTVACKERYLASKNAKLCSWNLPAVGPLYVMMYTSMGDPSAIKLLGKNAADRWDRSTAPRFFALQSVSPERYAESETAAAESSCLFGSK